MPHEVILGKDDSTKLIGSYHDAKNNSVVVGWNKIGWVQISVAPPGWESTGDWHIVDLNSEGLDKLIATLKRARRQAQLYD